MLVLARKKDDELTIGPDITIKVIEIRGDVVRLGIAAPKTLAVYRADRKKKEPKIKEVTSGVERQTV